MRNKDKVDRNKIVKLSEDAFQSYIKNHQVDPLEWLLFDANNFIGSFKDDKKATERSISCLFPFIKRADGTEIPKTKDYVFCAHTRINEDRTCSASVWAGIPLDQPNIKIQRYWSEVHNGIREQNDKDRKDAEEHKYEPLQIPFLIDTGSTCSVLSKDLITKLGFTEVVWGSIYDNNITGFGGTAPTKYYHGYIKFHAHAKMYYVRFCSHDRVNVIGMDILSQVNLFIPGGTDCIIHDL